jgi:sigma-B regulation protein RsbU (phosphoserine phosphatase)
MDDVASNEALKLIKSKLTSICSVFSSASSEAENLSSLCRSVLSAMLETFSLSRGAVLIYDDERGKLRAETSVGINLDEEIPIGQEDIRRMMAGKPLSASNLTIFPGHPRLALPLVTSGQFLGMVILGDKFNGGKLDGWEIQMLSLMAGYLATWIYNFKLVEQLRTANFELNHKVLQLEMLHEIGMGISSISIDLDELQDQVLTQAVALLNCRGGCIMLLDESQGKLRVTKSFEGEELEGVEVELSDEALAEFILEKDVSSVKGSDGVLPFGGTKILIAPIRGQYQTLGALAVWDKESRDGGILDFTEEDEALLSTFALQAGVAMENVRLYREALEKRQIEADIRAAADIQKHLLPEFDPDVEGLEISGMSVPCRGIGGDYYGYIHKRDKLAVAIGDVAGKGIQAALMMASLWAGVQAEAHDHDDPSEVATSLNSLMFKTTPPEKFATFFYGEIDLADFILLYVSAGHNPPMLISSEGKVSFLTEGGVPLGMFQSDIVTYSTGKSRLNVGDVLILYTDGVTEATNAEGETFGEERLKRTAIESRYLPASRIKEEIYRSVIQFQGDEPQFDDLTLIVVKRTA